MDRKVRAKTVWQEATPNIDRQTDKHTAQPVLIESPKMRWNKFRKLIHVGCSLRMCKEKEHNHLDIVMSLRGIFVCSECFDNFWFSKTRKTIKRMRWQQRQEKTKRENLWTEQNVEAKARSLALIKSQKLATFVEKSRRKSEFKTRKKKREERQEAGTKEEARRTTSGTRLGGPLSCFSCFSAVSCLTLSPFLASLSLSLFLPLRLVHSVFFESWNLPFEWQQKAKENTRKFRNPFRSQLNFLLVCVWSKMLCRYSFPLNQMPKRVKSQVDFPCCISLFSLLNFVRSFVCFFLFCRDWWQRWCQIGCETCGRWSKWGTDPLSSWWCFTCEKETGFSQLRVQITSESDPCVWHDSASHSSGIAFNCFFLLFLLLSQSSWIEKLTVTSGILSLFLLFTFVVIEFLIYSFRVRLGSLVVSKRSNWAPACIGTAYWLCATRFLFRRPAEDLFSPCKPLSHFDWCSLHHVDRCDWGNPSHCWEADFCFWIIRFLLTQSLC